MAITNNLLQQVDLPVWEWMRFAPVSTSALTTLTTSRDGKNKYIYYISGTQLYRYDTRADSWQVLSIGGSVATAIAAQYVNNQGYRGQVISSTTNTVKLPALGVSTIGYKIKIVSGVGIGQERTIISNDNEVVHDSGIVTTANTSILGDTTKRWRFNQWEGYGVRIMGNGGFGQTREVLYNDTNSLTVFDANYEGRDYMTVPYNSNFPYSAISQNTGNQTVYSIVSQVVTIDSDWTIQPDASSKFRIDSDGIWVLSGNATAPFYNLFYYDILSDRWVQKLASSGLLSSTIGTDISITPTTNIISDFILKGIDTSSTPTAVTSQSITDSTLSLTPGSLVGCVLRITSGLGLGQERRITSNTSNIFTLSNNWDILPNTSSTYIVTAENVLYISGNNSSKLYKYYPEQSVWTQGNLVDSGISLNLALLRNDVKQHHGVSSATINASGITSVAATPIAAGTGYVVGELITLSGGSSNGRVVVETISNIGAILSVSLYTAGTNYTTGTKTQASTNGLGSGAQINILTVGKVAAITTSINHDFQIGDVLTFEGATETAWNTSVTILGISSATVVEAITTATATAVATYTLSTSLVADVSKNWIPNQHAGKLLGIQSNGINGTVTYRKIIGNSNNTITFIAGTAPTNGNSRYFIQDLEALGDSETYLADNQLSYGFGSSASTVSTLVDTTKNWNLGSVFSAWTGNKVLVTDSLGASMETIITSNTGDTLNIGRTVAVGTGTANTIAYSENSGVTWTGLGVTIFSASGNSICWSGTRFIAGGQGTNTLAWSNDGVNWTGLGVTFFGTSCNGLSWNGTRFVAVGLGTNGLAYSNDGLTWIVTALGAGTFTTSGNAIAWSGTRFVAAGEGTNTLLHSIDGITWTIATNTLSTRGSSVCWNGTKFLAGGSGTNILTISTNGITWSSVGITAPTLFTQINGIAWNGTRFVAVGTVSSGTNCIAYSTDGLTWTVPNTSIFTVGNGVSWNGVNFVAQGTAGTNTIAYSADGITWTAATTGSLFSTTGKGSGSMTPFVSLTPNIGLVPGENTKYKIYDTTGTATGVQSTTQLQDLNKKWKVNQWAGSRLLITSGGGQMQEVAITSNTSNALVFGAITAPDLTSTYTIVQKPISGAGIQMMWNFGSSDLTTKGRLLYLPRGAGSAMFDIYNITTNRWKIGQYIQGMGEALNAGTMYTYDGKDRIFYQVTTTGRLFYYDIIKNQINPFGTIPYGMGTAVIGNRLEIITTNDNLSYLYLMKHSGQEMWRTLIFY